MVAVAGLCGLIVWLVTTVALRRSGLSSSPGSDASWRGGADLAWQRRPGEHGADAL